MNKTPTAQNTSYPKHSAQKENRQRKIQDTKKKNDIHTKQRNKKCTNHNRIRHCETPVQDYKQTNKQKGHFPPYNIIPYIPLKINLTDKHAFDLKCLI